MLQEVDRTAHEPDSQDTVVPHEPDSQNDLVSRMDAAHTRACAAQRELFCLILQAEECEEIWQRDGARDLAHWLAVYALLDLHLESPPVDRFSPCA
jgi:hypothetical protein